MNTFTIDISDVIFYLIPFIVIWIIVYRLLDEEDYKEDKIISSAILSMMIYFILLITYSILQTINLKIQL